MDLIFGFLAAIVAAIGGAILTFIVGVIIATVVLVLFSLVTIAVALAILGLVFVAPVLFGWDFFVEIFNKYSPYKFAKLVS